MIPLLPKQNGIHAEVEAVNLQPSTTFPAGQVLAYITGAANDVQTITESGSPSSGTFTLAGTNPLTGISFITPTIAQAASAATVQTTLTAATSYGAGNVTVSGSTGGPWTVTGAGALANSPIPLLALSTNSLAGGSSPTVATAHTTTGRTAGTYGIYSSTLASPPTVPVLTGTGSAGSTGGGDFEVTLTGVNAQGETTPGPSALITLTSTQSLHIAAISGLDTSFTGINVYVNGFYVGQMACAAGVSTASTFNEIDATPTHTFPYTNRAYKAPNGPGSQTAVGLNIYPCQTDAGGNIAYSTTQLVGEWGQTAMAAPMYVSGTFDVTLLTGLDAKAASDLGRLRWGTVTGPGELQLV